MRAWTTKPIACAFRPTRVINAPASPSTSVGLDEAPSPTRARANAAACAEGGFRTRRRPPGARLAERSAESGVWFGVSVRSNAAGGPPALPAAWIGRTKNPRFQLQGNDAVASDTSARRRRRGLFVRNGRASTQRACEAGSEAVKIRAAWVWYREEPGRSPRAAKGRFVVGAVALRLNPSTRGDDFLFSFSLGKAVEAKNFLYSVNSGIKPRTKRVSAMTNSKRMGGAPRRREGWSAPTTQKRQPARLMQQGNEPLK